MTEFLFSQMRVTGLERETLRTYEEVSTVNLFGVVEIWERLWSKSEVLSIAHRRNLCAALRISLIDPRMGSLLNSAPSLAPSLTCLLRQLAEEESMAGFVESEGLRGLVSLASCDSAAFSLVTEAMFARLTGTGTVGGVVWRVALLALLMAGEKEPEKTEQHAELWLTNVLACTGNSLSLTFAEWELLGDLSVFVLKRLEKNGANLSPLLGKLCETFLEAAKKDERNFLVSGLRVVAWVLRVGKCSFEREKHNVLFLKAAGIKFKNNSETIKFLESFRVYVEDSNADVFADAIFDLGAKLLPISDLEISTYLWKAFRALGPCLSPAISLRLSSRRFSDEQKAISVFILSWGYGEMEMEIVEKIDQTLLARAANSVILKEAICRLGQKMGIDKLSDLILDFLIDQSVNGEQLSYMEIVIGIASQRVWDKAISRIFEFPTEGLWQLSSILSSCDYGRLTMSESDFARLFIWLLVNMECCTDSAQKQIISKTIILFLEARASFYGSGGLNASEALNAYLNYLKDFAPERLGKFVEGSLGVIHGTRNVKSSGVFSSTTPVLLLKSLPAVLRMQLLKLVSPILVYSPSEDATFNYLETWVKNPEILNTCELREELGKMIGGLAVRFPDRTILFLDEKINSANDNSFGFSSILGRSDDPSWLRSTLAFARVVAVSEITNDLGGIASVVHWLAGDTTVSMMSSTPQPNKDPMLIGSLASALLWIAPKLQLKEILVSAGSSEKISMFFIRNLTADSAAWQPTGFRAIAAVISLAHKTPLDVSVLANVLDSSLKFLVHSIPDTGPIDAEILADKFDAVTKVAVSLFRHTEFSWLGASRLMQAVASVGLTGSVPIVRFMCMRIIAQLASETQEVDEKVEQADSSRRQVPASDQSLWACCLGLIIPRLSDPDEPTRGEAVVAINQLLLRSRNLRKFQVREDGGNTRTILLALFAELCKNQTNDSPLVVLSSDLARSVTDRSSMGGLKALVDLLSTGAREISQYSASLALGLLNACGEAVLKSEAESLSVECVCILLHAEFSSVFEEVFLCDKLSKQPTIFTTALKAAVRERVLLGKVLKSVANILASEAAGEPYAEAFSVLLVTLESDDLEVIAASRAFFSEFAVLALCLGNKFPLEAITTIQILAKHSFASIGVFDLTGEEGVGSCARALLSERPDASRAMMELALIVNESGSRTNAVIHILMAVVETTHDLDISNQARDWLFNFDAVRNDDRNLKRIQSLVQIAR